MHTEENKVLYEPQNNSALIQIQQLEWMAPNRKSNVTEVFRRNF